MIVADLVQDDPAADELVARVLDEHLLAGPLTGQCRCGWGDGSDVRTLGQSHSRHVAGQLRAALSAALAGRTVVGRADLAAKDQRIAELENLLHHARLRIDRDVARQDRARVWRIIADVRDAAPRAADDASTDDIIDALIDGGVLRLATESVTQKGDDQ